MNKHISAGTHEAQVMTARGVLLVTVNSKRSFARHSHRQYGIGMMDTGGHRSASGRGVVEAIRGDIIAVNPEEVHDGASIQGASRRWRMLYFDQAMVMAAASDMDGHVSATYEFGRPVMGSTAAGALFNQLFNAFGCSRGGGANALLREQSLLGLLACLGTHDPVSLARGVPAGILRAKAAMDADPAHAFTLAELSRLGDMGRYRTIRLFARATGLTPHAYLVQRRVELARQLIRGGQGLADAALHAGFSDQSHLTRVFSTRFGYTPGRYAAAVA